MRANTYSDGWNDHVPRATTFVSEEPKSYRVTYRNEHGKAFRVNIVQRPNPIGFNARLPGEPVGKPKG